LAAVVNDRHINEVDIGAESNQDIGALAPAAVDAFDINFVFADYAAVTYEEFELLNQKVFDPVMAITFCQDRFATSEAMVVVEAVLEGLEAAPARARPSGILI
jgi:hypothetical protein